MRRATIVAATLGVSVLAVSVGAARGSDELAKRIEEARSIYFEQGPSRALPLLEEIRDLARQQGDLPSEVAALRNIGSCNRRLGRFEESLTVLDEALRRARGTDLSLEVAKIGNGLGLTYWEMASYEPAIESFTAAIEQAKALGDKQVEGTLHNNLGLVNDELGHFDQSLVEYERALELYREVDFRRGEGDTLGNIGGVQLLLGRFRQALEYYERALVISRELGQKPSISLDLGNIGQCYLGMGEIDRALESYSQALALAHEAGLTQDEAYWLRGKAAALVRRGSYSDGFNAFKASLALYEQAEARAEQLQTLGELGQLHMLLGDVLSAKGYFEQAIEISREIGHRQGLTNGLLALGDLEMRLEHSDQAEALYRQALTQSREIRDRLTSTLSLLRLADLARSLGRTDSAGEDARQASTLASEIGSKGLKAESLLLVAEVGRLENHLAESLEGYELARELANEIGDPELLWRADHGRARALTAADRLPEAIEALEAAVKVIEGVRDQLREDRFRSGYLQDRYRVYVDLVRLLIETGRTGEAFRVSEQLRMRSHLDLLGRSGSRLRSREDRLREDELREKIRQLQLWLDQEGTRPASERRDAAHVVFSRELADAEREYQVFLDDLERRFPQRAALIPARVPAANEVQALLGPDEALIEYVIGDAELTVFLLTETRLEVKQIPLSPGELDAKIGLLRDLIARAQGDQWRRPAASLRSILISPLEQPGWLDGIERLWLVPHGVLHYLPFATLAAGTTEDAVLLVEDYVVSHLPSAAALRTHRADTRAPKSLLALAPHKSRLQFSRREVYAIAGYFDEPLVLVDSSATEAALKQHSAGFRQLHLATHGYFNKINPMLSGLVLEPAAGEDGLLEVHEILGLNLDAELVVLSACETALGSGYFSEVPAGNEFLGLTRAFLSAGSRSVLATLWAVDDRSTLAAIEIYYRGLYDSAGEIDAALALAKTQRQLLAGDAASTHPYFWAPFVLVGVSNSKPQTRSSTSGVQRPDNRPTGP